MKISYRYANRYESPPCSTSANIPARFAHFAPFRPVPAVCSSDSVRLSRSLLSLLISASPPPRLHQLLPPASAFKPSTVQPATDLFRAFSLQLPASDLFRAASTTSQPFKPSDLFRLQLL
uniref:Uncharacterized protein n=1 Tax=Fagus sylvatica TaxID=28930 RepID=A0A2N9FC06_FAGSY